MLAPRLHQEAVKLPTMSLKQEPRPNAYLYSAQSLTPRDLEKITKGVGVRRLIRRVNKTVLVAGLRRAGFSQSDIDAAMGDSG